MVIIKLFLFRSFPAEIDNGRRAGMVSRTKRRLLLVDVKKKLKGSNNVRGTLIHSDGLIGVGLKIGFQLTIGND